MQKFLIPFILLVANLLSKKVIGFRNFSIFAARLNYFTMALIGKIREKFSILLLVLIGGSLLAFILNDFLSNRGAFNSQDRSVGEIAGEEISVLEFENRVNREVANYEERQQQPATADVVQTIREQVWYQILTEKLIDKEIAKLGLDVSPEELFDMIQGKNIHPQVKQAFTNPQTGEFNKQDVIRFLKNMDQDPSGKAKAQWLQFEDFIAKERLRNKYYTLIKKGLYATSLEAKIDHINNNKKMNIQYVVKRYESLPDSLVSISDDEIEEYYSEHKNLYKQDESREILYVSWDIYPTQKDFEEARKWAEDIVEEWAAIKDPKEDTLFILNNSDNPMDPQYYSPGKGLPLAFDTVAFNKPEGTVLPPVMEGNVYQIAKVIKFKEAPDSVKARHILINIEEQGDSAAFAKADSLKKLLEQGKAKFEDLAKEFSQDFGSAQKGGDLGWFTEGVMVKPFNDACFSAKKGEMKIVKSEFGVHLIKVEDIGKPVRKALVGIIERRVEPGNETFEQAYNEASSFSFEVTDAESFEKIAKEKGYILREANVKPNDRLINDIAGARELVRWAFNNDKNEISEPMRFDNKIVVAVIKEVYEKGIAPLEFVKEDVKREVLKEKKYQMFSQEFGTYTSLQELSGQLKLPVENAVGITFANYSIPNVGREPYLQGKIFSLDKGQLSKPIKGNTGTFAVYVSDIIEAPEMTDPDAIQKRIMSGMQNRVQFEVYEALREKANVVDKRIKFY